MSEKESAASSAEQGEQEKDFVLDFLYHDARRVGSFLAQFNDSGHLQQIRESEATARNIKRGWKFSVGGGLADEFGKGEVALERGPTQGGSQASERTFDPLWANARELLDLLESRSLIQRDVVAARIGQFVLVKGMLLILDLAMLKAAWEKGSIKKLMTAGMEVERKKNKPKGQQQLADTQQIQIMIDLLGLLPHTIQASILNDKYRAWCCLSEQSLVGLSSDLLLKHGAYVPGEWSILGVLDALPDLNPEEIASEPRPASIDEIVATLAGTVVGTVAAQMAPVARELLGRPRIAHGVTPLLIFREVSGDPPPTPDVSPA